MLPQNLVRTQNFPKNQNFSPLQGVRNDAADNWGF